MDKRDTILANKKTVILASIVTIVIGAVVCLFAIIWLVKNSPKQQTATISKQANHARMVESYKNDIKPVIKEYQQVVDSINRDSSENNYQALLTRINTVKNKMTEIVVPAEYKDLHIDIFFGILSLEKYLTDNSLDDKTKGEDALVEVKKDNNWLNE